MYATYGDYVHTGATAVNLVRMEYLPQYSTRGKKWAVMYRMHIHGELIASTQESIGSLIDGLIAAYEVNYKDWVLWDDNGNKTKHRMENGGDNDLSGVKVVHRAWPDGGAAEYATGRVYSVVLEQLVRDTDSEILAYEQSVRYIGNGGPDYRMITLPNGTPYWQMVSLWTPVQVVQRGTVVGSSIYPTGNVASPIFPAYEHNQQRIIDFVHPEYHGKGYSNYRINWTYSFTLPGYVLSPPGTPIY